MFLSLLLGTLCFSVVSSSVALNLVYYAVLDNTLWFYLSFVFYMFTLDLYAGVCNTWWSIFENWLCCQVHHRPLWWWCFKLTLLAGSRWTLPRSSYPGTPRSPAGCSYKSSRRDPELTSSGMNKTVEFIWLTKIN